MINLVINVGRKTNERIEIIGEWATALLITCGYFITSFNLKTYSNQIYRVGVGSLVIICVTGLFTGMVLALQGYYTLAKLGSEGLLGSMVALSIIRELGPVLGALMIAGRAGSSITAEIGIMKVTQQIDAIIMMGVNPNVRVILPRVVACIIATPLLIMVFNFVGIWAGEMIGIGMFDISEGTYIGEAIDKVNNHDIYTGVIKSVVFGVIVGSISTFLGIKAAPTTAGVAKATTATVVYCSVAILAADYILTSLFI